MKFQSFDLSGKVALVTGGAGLLGVQHSSALLDAGATVFVTDIDEQGACQACATLGSKSYALVMDVTDELSVERGLNYVLEKAGRVDILINNAALDPKVTSEEGQQGSRVENFSLSDWEFQLNVGLTGAFICSKIFGSWMARNGGGVILNISSDLSVIAPDQRLYVQDGLAITEQPVKPVTYSVIKTGLIGLTRYLAAYWATFNVRVNALSPGGVYANQPDEFVKKLTDKIPLGRMARCDEYRGAVQFMCSNSSTYLTGQNIVIDGGRSVI